jgi:hypothetical protein
MSIRDASIFRETRKTESKIGKRYFKSDKVRPESGGARSLAQSLLALVKLTLPRVVKRDWTRYVHGTLICKVCPWFQLYASFTTESAIKVQAIHLLSKSSCNPFINIPRGQAIRWAIGYGIDIISISWAIANCDLANKDVKQLQEAFTTARKKEKILMFCSARDKDPNRRDNIPCQV